MKFFKFNKKSKGFKSNFDKYSSMAWWYDHAKQQEKKYLKSRSKNDHDAWRTAYIRYLYSCKEAGIDPKH